MRKVLQIAMAVLFTAIAGIPVKSQDCEAYFPMDEGAVRVMENYNEKDKLEGKITYEVKEVTVSGDLTSATVHMIMEDKKGEELQESDLIMECEAGVFRIDMKSYMQAGMMPDMGEMEVEIDSKNLEFPSGLSVGMELPDGYINITMASSGITMMGMKVDIFNRKVEARETIETPAGSFDCFKISQQSEMKSMMKVKTSSIEWIAKDVGVVRSESFDKKGKSMGYSILTKFEN